MKESIVIYARQRMALKRLTDAASELGITLPTPDDLHWQAFFETYK